MVRGGQSSELNLRASEVFEAKGRTERFPQGPAASACAAETCAHLRYSTGPRGTTRSEFGEGSRCLSIRQVCSLVILASLLLAG